MTKSVEQLERDWEIAKERDFLSPRKVKNKDCPRLIDCYEDGRRSCSGCRYEWILEEDDVEES